MSTVQQDLVEEPAASADFTHVALLYCDLDEFLDSVLRFVRDGLAAGEPVLVAVPQPRLDLVRDRLGAQGTDVRFVDMADAGANPGRIIPDVLKAFANVYADRRLRIVGEPIWPGRSAAECAAGVQHEALINLAFAGSTATLLCPVDVTGLDPSVVTDAERTHPLMVESGKRRDSRAFTDPSEVAWDATSRLKPPPGGADVLIFNAVSEVRRFVDARAGRVGLDPERLAELQVAVGEVAANTLTHGHGVGVLRVWEADDRLVCEVRDDGHIADPLVGRIAPPSAADREPGLFTAHRLCDLVQVSSSPIGTAVRLHKRCA